MKFIPSTYKGLALEKYEVVEKWQTDPYNGFLDFEDKVYNLNEFVYYLQENRKEVFDDSRGLKLLVYQINYKGKEDILKYRILISFDDKIIVKQSILNCFPSFPIYHKCITKKDYIAYTEVDRQLNVIKCYTVKSEESAKKYNEDIKNCDGQNYLRYMVIGSVKKKLEEII